MIQDEADRLIAVPKMLDKPQDLCVPQPGVGVSVDAHSTDRRHSFVFNVYRGRLNLGKCTYNNRIRRGYTLVRVCLSNRGHKNPDGQVIREPHIHLYKEGYEDRWAYPLPPEIAEGSCDLVETLGLFMEYCGVTNCPPLQGGLF